MTEFLPVEVTCYVCKQASTQTPVVSYYNIGSPDLDTRPPEMQRSTLPHWVQVCPHCGYVASKVSEGTDATPQIIRSDHYRAQLTDSAYPELATRFLCWALVQEQQGNPIGAGWSSVHAAWASDDAGDAAAAARCRRRALQLFARGRKTRRRISQQRYAEYPLLTDLWRRVGDFEAAIGVCREGLSKIAKAKQRRRREGRGTGASEDIALIEKILRYQESLVEGRDAAARTVEEALARESPGK